MNAPSPRETFLAERQTGLGASDVSAILGYNPYRSAVEVFLEKTGAVPADDSSMRLRFGQYNEEFVAQEYQISTGLRVQRFNPMLRHADYPMVLGHVDRLVIPPGQKIAAHKREIRTDRGLEAKTVDDFVYNRSGEWGEPGTDEVPTYYLIQCAIYMSLTKCSRWDLAALIGSGAKPLAVYQINRDADLEDELLRRSAEWWNKHVVAGVAPDPESESDVDLLFRQAKSVPPVISTPEIEYHVARLRKCRKAGKHLERIESEHAMAVKRALGNADTLIKAGTEFEKKPTKLVTWNNRKGRTGFDLDSFVGHLCPGANPAERSLFIEDAKRSFTTRGEDGRTLLLK